MRSQAVQRNGRLSPFICTQRAYSQRKGRRPQVSVADLAAHFKACALGCHSRVGLCPATLRREPSSRRHPHGAGRVDCSKNTRPVSINEYCASRTYSRKGHTFRTRGPSVCRLTHGLDGVCSNARIRSSCIACAGLAAGLAYHRLRDRESKRECFRATQASQLPRTLCRGQPKVRGIHCALFYCAVFLFKACRMPIEPVDGVVSGETSRCPQLAGDPRLHHLQLNPKS